MREQLIQQLNTIKNNSTNTEWLVFVLIYYERLSLKEISCILDKNIVEIEQIFDSVLRKAVPILGNNVELLRGL